MVEKPRSITVGISGRCVLVRIIYISIYSHIRVVQRKQLGVRLFFFSGKGEVVSTVNGRECVPDFG